MSWRKFLLIPMLIQKSARAPKAVGEAWERYWATIDGTGPGGDVLWDPGHAEELEFFNASDTKTFEQSVGLKKKDVVAVYEAAARATCDHYIDDVSCADGITYWMVPFKIPSGGRHSRQGCTNG